MQKKWLRCFLCLIALGAVTASASPAMAVSEWAFEAVSPPQNLKFEAGKLQRFSLELKNTGSQTWGTDVALTVRFLDDTGNILKNIGGWYAEKNTLPGEKNIFLTNIPKMAAGIQGKMEIDLKHREKGLFSDLSETKPLTIAFKTIPKSLGFMWFLVNAVLLCSVLWIFSPSIFRRMPKAKKIWMAAQYPLAAVGIFLVSRMVVFLAFATRFLYSSAASIHGSFSEQMTALISRAWDGGWYLIIVNSGYSFSPEKGGSIAFYPLYPLLGGAVEKVFGVSPEAALLLVSNLFSILAAVVIYKLFEHFTRDAKKALLGVTFFSIFPTSLFLSTAYAESLFIFLLGTAFLLFLKFRETIPAYCVSALALITKVPGILLLPTFFCSAFTKSGKRWVFDKQKLIWLPVILIPYMLFLLYSKIKFGTFFAPFLAQKAWHGGQLFEIASSALQKMRELFDFSIADMLGNQRIFFENYQLPKQLSLYECFSFLLLCLIVAGLIIFWKRLDRTVKLWCLFLTAFFLLLYFKSGMGFGVISRFFMYYFPMFFVAGFLNTHIRNILIMVFTAMLFFTSFLFIWHDVFIV